MDAIEMEEVLTVLRSSLSQIKWHLRPASKRRLETDVLALCSRMRPVIMVDYGGKMPELIDQLCSFLKLSQKESSIFKHLRVMVIEDMIYLIHVEGLAELVKSTLNSELELNFVDIEQDPPKMISKAEENSLGFELIAVQKLFALAFPSGEAAQNDLVDCHTADSTATAESSTRELIISQSSEFIDLSCCMQDTLVTVPTLNGSCFARWSSAHLLNYIHTPDPPQTLLFLGALCTGWLLGYPVVYLFSKEHISDAIYNLSTKSLHLYRILASRNGSSSKGYRKDEILSFSVPYDLSIEGSKEPWAEAFMSRMLAKLERCRQVWGSLKLEVSGCSPQAIVF